MCRNGRLGKGTYQRMAEEETLTRRERRIAARQSQILTAAARVFSQKGYAGATTREIAETADMAEGTLYNYFGCKQDLLIGVAEAYADDVVAYMQSLAGDSMGDMMRQLFAARFRSGRERRLFMVLLSEARLNPDIDHSKIQAAFYRIIEATEAMLTAAIAAGRMRPVNVRVAARAFSATIMGFGALFELGGDIRAGLTADNDGTFSPDWLGDMVTDLYLHGLKLEE